MSEGFKKHKRKYLLHALFKSAALAVASGLLVTGVLLLSLKLSGVQFSALYYALTGVGAALLCGVAAFLFLRPTDRKVAVRLDREFDLEERVQTALEFESAEGTLVELQRRDTEQKLQSLPAARIKFSQIWQYCVCLVVALAIILTGIFVPAKTAGAVPDGEPTIEITQWHFTAVEELIEDVKDSALASIPKEGVVSELESFLEELEKINTQSALQAAVVSTVGKVEDIILEATTYIDVAAELNDAGCNYIAQAVRGGGRSYKYYRLTEYSQVKDFYSSRYDAVEQGISSPIDKLSAQIDGLTGDGLSDAVTALYVSILSIATSHEEPLKAILFDFAMDTFWAAYNNSEDEEAVKDEMAELFEGLKTNLTVELSAQAYNLAVATFAGNRLKIIFDMPVADPETRPSESTGSGGGEGSGDDDSQSGGWGQGGLVGGSDEEIYDPETGTYVKYVDLMEKYLQLLQAYLSGDELTEEQKNTARTYFDLLFGNE